MQKKADLALSLLVLAMLVWMVWEARGWSLQARLFPWTIGIPAMVLAFVQCGFAVRRLRSPEPKSPPQATTAAPDRSPAGSEAPAPGSEGSGAAVVAAAVEGAFGAGSSAAEEEQIPVDVVRRRTLEMSAWILVFALAIVLVGFTLSTGLLSLAFMRLAAHEKWRTGILVSLAGYVSFYALFAHALSIPFPAGLLAEWAGLDSFDSYLMNPLLDLLFKR